jgi:predicted CopG family antitoxin
MSRTITVSDQAYARLEAEAKKRGMNDVAQLLEKMDEWREAASEEDIQREAAVQRILDLRAEFVAAYGEMPDSAELIREDRER